ncbi:unnamed protein product [Pleuronectes platessa]|uniref:Uncharacterized protein n=1 Tax=Pleuronectes platessa TaxID=8262 RepID=A0A9N7VQC3_PLEPL|nr:unnamed protein product [Pleuronectes platessa]
MAGAVAASPYSPRRRLRGGPQSYASAPTAEGVLIIALGNLHGPPGAAKAGIARELAYTMRGSKRGRAQPLQTRFVRGALLRGNSNLTSLRRRYPLRGIPFEAWARP